MLYVKKWRFWEDKPTLNACTETLCITEPNCQPYSTFQWLRTLRITIKTWYNRK